MNIGNVVESFEKVIIFVSCQIFESNQAIAIKFVLSEPWPLIIFEMTHCFFIVSWNKLRTFLGDPLGR